MAWDVEVSDEFTAWWDGLSEGEQDDVTHVVILLEQRGPDLPHPYSSKVTSSRHDHMRELRVQHAGRPIRILYAFDPRRIAIMLLGGDKTGNKRWYDQNVPTADRLYDTHLEELTAEGLI